jgi:hypothetical protein
MSRIEIIDTLILVVVLIIVGLVIVFKWMYK